MEEEKKYIKGFNHGYLLAKHEPELFNKLTQGLGQENEYCKGLVSGGRSLKADKLRSLSSMYLQNDPGITKDKPKGKQTDKDLDR